MLDKSNISRESTMKVVDTKSIEHEVLKNSNILFEILLYFQESAFWKFWKRFVKLFLEIMKTKLKGMTQPRIMSGTIGRVEKLFFEQNYDSPV